MKLVTVLGMVSIAAAASMVVISADFYGVDDPYFLWGIALLAVPPAVIGLLLFAPWRALRVAGGWLALLVGFLWVVAVGTGVLGGILDLVAGSGQQDLAGTLAGWVAGGLFATLNLVIFWAAAWRDRGSRTSTPSRPTLA